MPYIRRGNTVMKQKVHLIKQTITCNKNQSHRRTNITLFTAVVLRHQNTGNEAQVQTSLESGRAFATCPAILKEGHLEVMIPSSEISKQQ